MAAAIQIDMSNKIFPIFALLIAASTANAECFIKSHINLKAVSLLAGPTDFQKIVVKDSAGFKCSIQYRVNIDDEWQTAEGVGIGPSQAEACFMAQDLNKASLLKEVAPKSLSSDTQMVCTDLPEIRIRKVRINEEIWESETDLHQHPDERKYFNYKRTKCRMFTERASKDRNFFTYQGVICQITNNPSSKWIVVDKY